MTLREFLHIEIWSKRTSRKIFIAFGVIAFALAVFYEIDRRWISPKERKAGIEALAAIDALQVGSDQQFDVVDSKAKNKVEAAAQVSLTTRDSQIALGLLIYLSGTELERQQQKIRSSSDERLRKLAVQNDPRIEQALHQVHDQLGHTLHRVLE